MKKNPAPFRFKHFLLHQSANVMKVSTDSILLGAWAQPGQAKNILDIGTGTGILALLMAQKSAAEIDAIDIHPEACSLAKRNFMESPWAGRLNIYHSSLQNYTSEKKYDLIISNPPYFNNGLKSPSPARNLFRHNDSLQMKDLVHFINHYLTRQGTAFISMPAAYTESIVEQMKMVNMGCANMLLVSSSHGNIPYLALLKIGREYFSSPHVETIVTHEKDCRYSTPFITLTKDIYSTALE